MLKAVADRVKVVQAQEAQGVSIRVVPILGPSHDEPDYVLLGEETKGKVEVTEISSAGSVPTLRVINRLDRRVFLMDGQELIGAKQNRILNTDVLVPAGVEMAIPVSCVEQGRWEHNSPHFSAGKAASHCIRLDKMARVHGSLAAAKGYDADQSAVWENVERSLAVAGAADSKTRSLADAYARRAEEMSAFRRRLHIPEHTVGLAVFHGARFMGLDIFDRHTTLTRFWESLIDSYTVDYLESPVDLAEPPTNCDAHEIKSVFGAAQSGDWQAFDSPGEGTDWRWAQSHLCGAALVWEERIVLHLQLLPRDGGSVDSRRRAGRSRPPSMF